LEKQSDEAVYSIAVAQTVVEANPSESVEPIACKASLSTIVQI